jgi:hypothetical protein
MIIVKRMSQNNIPRWDIELANFFKNWTSLVKIQIGEAFWIEDDLSLVDNKNTLKQHQGWKQDEKQQINENAKKKWQNDNKY